MSSRRRRPHSPAVKTPLEDDDLLSEILLRLPPDPSSLPRASLVCKRWHSLASDRSFFRRFRIHHRRKPPLLGFFKANYGGGLSFVPTLEAPNRVPPSRFSLQHEMGDDVPYVSLGCRHGLMLIFDETPKQMLVWDPVTGDQHRFGIPPGIPTHSINGAVLRAAEEVDHFQVVLAVADNHDEQHRRALACVYSSQTGLWGDIISTPIPSGNPGNPRNRYQLTLVYTGKPAVLAGNSLYWTLNGNFVGVLEFDLEKQILAVIRVPSHMHENFQLQNVRVEGGDHGLLVHTGCILQLWKRKTDCNGVASWALGKAIDMDKLLLLNSLSITVLGFAEENNVVFLFVCGVLFMVHLESLQFKKIECCTHHPFESVYPAGI